MAKYKVCVGESKKYNNIEYVRVKKTGKIIKETNKTNSKNWIWGV